MANIVGIDLGTTNSLVAIVETAFLVSCRDAMAGKLVPSIIHFSKSGEVLVGNDAKARSH
jgi:molecular chaperone DnaK (HSP70)